MKKKRKTKLALIIILQCVLSVFLLGTLYFVYASREEVSLEQIIQLNQPDYLKKEHRNIMVVTTENDGKEETVFNEANNTYLIGNNTIYFNRQSEQIRYGYDNISQYLVVINNDLFPDPWNFISDYDLSEFSLVKKKETLRSINFVLNIEHDKLYDYAKWIGLDVQSGLGSADLQIDIDKKTKSITGLAAAVYDTAGNKEYYQKREISYDAEFDLNQFDPIMNRIQENGDKKILVITDPDTVFENTKEYFVGSQDLVVVVTDKDKVVEKTYSDYNEEIYHIYSSDKERNELPDEKAYDASGFVLLSEYVPDAILEIRYYSTYNFIGERFLDYEEPIALTTLETAKALKEVSDELIEKGYRLKIFDAYRPSTTEDYIMDWADDESDIRMKEYFYPNLDKETIIDRLYLARRTGHSRGSAVDLTLFDMETEREVDMGTTYDFLDESSHPDYEEITEEQYANRMILREAMLNHGFRPFYGEWWHFVLINEPYPGINFAFPVSKDVLNKNN